MYQNRIMYSSLQMTNPSFITKVLFAINSALQIHWQSCSQAPNRSSVYDKVLLMQDCQDQILCHNFLQQLPRLLLYKINYNNNLKFPPGRKCFHLPDKEKDHNNKDIITDSDKSHLLWWIKEGENFAQVFYANQKKCPKATDGKTICMKLFLRGICDKSINFHWKMKKHSFHLSITAGKEVQGNRIFTSGQGCAESSDYQSLASSKNPQHLQKQIKNWPRSIYHPRRK